MNILYYDTNDTVRPTPEALAIKEFRELYEADTSKSKSKAWRQLAAAFFIASISSKNIYKGYKAEERIEEVTKDLLDSNPTFGMENKLFVAVVSRIVAEEEKSLMKSFFRTSLKFIRKLQDFLEDADLTELDDSGKLKYDAKKNLEILKQAADTAKTLTMLEKEVRREEEDTDGNKIRGGGEDEYDI